jgi:hypothetical protein
MANLSFPKKTPSIQNAKTTTEVLGDMPVWMNLKDNMQLDGQKIAIIGAEIAHGTIPSASGELSDYCRIAAFMVRDGQIAEPVVIQTGAGDIVEKMRVMMETNGASPDAPMLATLRLSSGRVAWLLE